MSIRQSLEKVFVLSPWNFLKFHYLWRNSGIKFRENSHLATAARYSAYQSYRTCVIAQLRKRFHTTILSSTAKIRREHDLLPHDSSNKIWVCWLQGMEAAPDIVKICYESIRRHFADREVILITEDNYSDYVTIPQEIVKKYQNSGGGGGVYYPRSSPI